MTGEVLGRDLELGSVDAFLDRVEGLAGLVLEGEPGVGKSTLWLAAIARARERGFRVLSSRPAEPERDRAHLVLGDLFEEVLDDVLPALAVPRRRALELALLTGQAPDHPVDERALGVAVRESLQILAERTPLLLAVDDEQWLDRSSANALRFALRRLRDERVLLLPARRPNDETEMPGLENAVAPDRAERLVLGPLSMGALHLLLQRRLKRSFARPTLLRLLELSGGNPFYALELARELGPEDAAGDTTEGIPVPESLEQLVGARLEQLPNPTREALRVVAVHGRPSRSLLRTSGVATRALEPAVAAQVLAWTGNAVRFTHPLLASALYQSASPEERRRTHERLATIVDDPVERGRHLALATEEPDEEVATTLEESADLALARGTIFAAAELGEHALRLTPPHEPEERHRRALATAKRHLESGEARRARARARPPDLVACRRTTGGGARPDERRRGGSGEPRARDRPAPRGARSRGSSPAPGREKNPALADLDPPPAGPGVWQPAPAPAPALGLRLPGVRPIALKSASQFRPAGPPSLTERLYAEDFDQVKALDRLDSATRTAEQTIQARFWTSPTATSGRSADADRRHGRRPRASCLPGDRFD